VPAWVKDLKADIAKISDDVAGIKNKVKGIENKVKGIKNKVKGNERQLGAVLQGLVSLFCYAWYWCYISPTVVQPQGPESSHS
jgi:prophage DNA circulation protein